MAYEVPGFKLPSHIAGADLSDNQYYVVEISDEGEVGLADADTDFAVGILQDDPDNGEEAEVMVTGVSKVATQVTDISAGDYLTWDANGRVDNVTTGEDTIIGIALEDSPASISDDVFITMLLISIGEIDLT